MFNFGKLAEITMIMAISSLKNARFVHRVDICSCTHIIYTCVCFGDDNLLLWLIRHLTPSLVPQPTELKVCAKKICVPNYYGPKKFSLELPKKIFWEKLHFTNFDQQAAGLYNNFTCMYYYILCKLHSHKKVSFESWEIDYLGIKIQFHEY